MHPSAHEREPDAIRAPHAPARFLSVVSMTLTMPVTITPSDRCVLTAPPRDRDQQLPYRFERYKQLTAGYPSMELRVTESSEDELSIEIAGEDHTFMNVLKGSLLEHDDVSAATYDVNPEQSGGQTEPILTIKTESGVDPLEALEDAAVDVREKAVSFRDAFETAA